MGQVVLVLAVVRGETPRSVVDRLFTACEEDERWRDDFLPRLQRIAARSLF